MSEHDWFNFLLGVIAANQVWLAVLFLYITPKVNELRAKAEGGNP